MVPFSSCNSCSARNTQVAASLLQACYFAVIKPISGCVCIACSGLMITSLLHVVNRLAASSLSRLFIHKFDACCFNNLQQVCNYQVTTSVIFTDLCNLMKSIVRSLSGKNWQDCDKADKVGISFSRDSYKNN